MEAVPEGSCAGQQPGLAGAVGLLEGVLPLLSGRLQPHHEETQVQPRTLNVAARQGTMVV